MFPKNKVLGVTGSHIRTNHGYNGSSQNAVMMGRNYSENANKVTASLAGLGPGGGGAASLSVNAYWNSQYQYLMTGIIPADPQFTDTSSLALFYRDIYLFDSVGGSAVDIQSTFPFSEFELRGLKENELDIYRDALEQLNIMQNLPILSMAYLVDGFFCGSLVFDAHMKKFMDILVHDALQCTVIPSPMLNGMPAIRVRVGAATQQYMYSDDPYARKKMDSLPNHFQEMLREGNFCLNPVSTLYMGRRTLTDRSYVSFLHRLLPMYLIEKTMFRGTLVEAARRQRATTHLTAGDDLWTPSTEELQALVQQFQLAEYDPLGGWVSTRNAVQATDIRPGGDFWKWTDMADILVPYKLRALGISESFLSGDASYASAESAYSTFLETMNAYRNQLTHAIFYSTLFPLIAVANGLYKDPSNRVKGNRVSEYLSVASNRANLKIPQLIWHKSLEAKGEDNKFDMLEKASDKGVPIPLKTWMAAAGVDPEVLEKDLREDKQYRAQLAQYTGKDTTHEGEDEEGDEDFDPEEAMEASMRQFTTQSINDPDIQRRKASWASRNFGEYADQGQTRTGKPKYVHNARMKQRDVNGKLAKIAAMADKDPRYAHALVESNRRAGRPLSYGFLDGSANRNKK